MKHEKEYGFSMYRWQKKVAILFVINLAAILLFMFVEWRSPDLRVWLWTSGERIYLLFSNAIAGFLVWAFSDMNYDMQNGKEEKK